jgi:hypothetical protein
MKFILFFLTFCIQSFACEFGNDSSCKENQHCVFSSVGEPAICVDNYIKTLPEVLFPFNENNPTKCWKSHGRIENSSHAWRNALYAIDLHSEPGNLGIIRAGLSGRVISFEGCSANQPHCNSSFGNQVKIFSENGIMIYYVHLSNVFVKTGDIVKIGQPIAIEGMTGNVGGMWGKPNDFHHLHMSVHSDWRRYDFDYHNNTWPGMDSIPFKLIMKNNETRDIRDIKCSKFDEDAHVLYGLDL